MSRTMLEPRYGRDLSAFEITAQLQEALVMAGMVSLRDDLAVELGEWWAFDWMRNVITLPLAELRTCPTEEISWIILHEAAHAAITRLHDIVPVDLRKRPEIAYLLNCIEDVRIERWLVDRFPGAIPWQTVAREVASQFDDPDAAPAEAFLRGVLHLGEKGGVPEKVHPAARRALEEARPALERAFACVPPSIDVAGASVNDLYAGHPVARCYAALDSAVEPAPVEKWARIMQYSMWYHVHETVLPIFLRLVGEYGAPKLPSYMRSIRVTHPGGSPGGTRGARSAGGTRSAAELKRALREELVNGGRGRYLDRVSKYHSQIEQITALLMRMLPNHRGLRHVRRCRTGDRLDVRTACQFEVDPRLHDQLWMQRKLRTLPDPAFVFVMDRSGSMKNDGKSVAAFESLVLLREACTRTGIPFAITMFSDEAEQIHDWNQMEDDTAMAALSVILKPDGGTSIEAALEHAEDLIKARPERDRFIFLMTDGDTEISERARIRRHVGELREEGVKVIAIGVGNETVAIRELFSESKVIRSAAELPAAMSDGLLAAIRELSGSW